MEIINARDLTPRQWYLFVLLYHRYFRNEYVKKVTNPIINRAKMYLTGGGLAEQSLYNIKCGALTSFVILLPDEKEHGKVPIGFITGYETIEGILKLNDIYLEYPSHSLKIEMLKRLYRQFVTLASTHGIDTIQGASNDMMPEKTNYLLSLGLNPVDSFKDTTIYKAHIMLPKEEK